MKYEDAKLEGSGGELHIPQIITKGNLVMVKIGKSLHPMDSDHFIEWIEVRTNLDVYVKKFKPGDLPLMEFFKTSDENVLEVFAYCNVHGLWGLKMPVQIKSSCAGQLYMYHSLR